MQAGALGLAQPGLEDGAAADAPFRRADSSHRLHHRRRGMQRGGAVPMRHGSSECAKMAAAKRERRENQDALMHKLLTCYDVNQSGRLEASELTKLLTDYSEATFDRKEEPGS